MIQTLEWTNTGVVFIDQTKLPTEEVYVNCTTHEQVADVIRNMVVRGAPAIGVAAGMGIALGVMNSTAESGADLKKDFDQICEVIRQTRPTAVNLFWAIKRIREKFETLHVHPIAHIKLSLVEEAQRMRSEEHTSELQSQSNLVCRLLLEKKKNNNTTISIPCRSFGPWARGSTPYSCSTAIRTWPIILARASAGLRSA